MIGIDNFRNHPMKTTLVGLALSLLLSCPAFAKPNLKAAVKRQIAIFEKSKNNRLPTLYPELADKLKGLFSRYPATHIVISGFYEGAEKETADIYIQGEDIYIDGTGDGWNLAANKSGVFEWKNGKKSGIKIKRNDDDLVAYLYYATDPSWIIASLYYEYLTSPHNFSVVPNKNKKWIELRLKIPRYGFGTIYVSEKPLWFYGMRFTNPETGRRVEVMISEPEEVKVLPPKLSEQLKGMKFEDSALTLKRHMMFL